MRIDVHAHDFPSQYLDRLERYGGSQVTGLIWKMKLDSADFSGLQDHFRIMDISKVDMQILSVSGQLPYFAKENDAEAQNHEESRCERNAIRDPTATHLGQNAHGPL